MADFYDLREIVTSKFYERHVVLTRARTAADLSEPELDDVAKKLAEGVYQSRDVAVSSVVVMGWHEVMRLKMEAKAKQAQYENAAPGQEFITDATFPLYARGSREGAPAAKKRATYLGCRRFKYGVVAVQAEHGLSFKIDHYGGAV